MATALCTNEQWSTGPVMTFDAEYTATRSGANMVYVVKVSMDALVYGTYGRTFGYPIYCSMTLDGSAVSNCSIVTAYGSSTGSSSGVTIKAASPSNWSDGAYYATITMTIAKTTGSTALAITLYSGGGTSYPSKTWSFSLPVSAAASTSAAKSFVVGTAGSFAITRYSSSFTDTITYSFGSVSGTIASGSTASSVSWTPPLTLLNQMLGVTSKTGTFTVATYSGSTLVGSNSYTLTLTTASAYYLPVVKVAHRRGTGSSDSDFSVDDSGTTVRVTVTSSVYGSGSPGSLSVTLDGTTTTKSNVQSGSENFYFAGKSTQNSYTYSATLTDAVGNTSTMSGTVSTEAVPMNLNVTLPAVAFGKLAETANAVELADGWEMRYNGNTMSGIRGYNLQTDYGNIIFMKRFGIVYVYAYNFGSSANLPTSWSSYYSIPTWLYPSSYATSAIHITIPNSTLTASMWLYINTSGQVAVRATSASSGYYFQTMYMAATL